MEIVVEGTVLRFGERVRISVQLIEAHTDTHLWAESYERKLQDILALHADVAQAVARERAPEESVTVPLMSADVPTPCPNS